MNMTLKRCYKADRECLDKNGGKDQEMIVFEFDDTKCKDGEIGMAHLVFPSNCDGKLLAEKMKNFAKTLISEYE